MSRTKTVLILLFIFLQLSHITGQDTYPTFTKEQIQDDLSFLKLHLEKHHPNLYLYSNQEKINAYFKELGNYSTDNFTCLKNNGKLNSYESLRLISSVSSVVKDGHFVLNPDQNSLEQFYTSAPLFPLDIFWDKDNAYVIKNYNDSEIKIGSKIISINGIETAEIRKTILNNVLRDGNNITYPAWIINNFFRAFFKFYYGSFETYTIEYSDDSLDSKTIEIKGLTHSEIKESRKNKYPKYYKSLEEEEGIGLSINLINKSAIIKIRSFENRMLRVEYQQKFRKTIKEYFKVIREEEIKHLTIDLRGNQGGEVTNGIFLLKHLLDEPFQAVESFTKVDKNNYNNLALRNKEISGFIQGYKKPFKRNNYKHDLYLMINGGSFSCSGIVAQALKSTKRATFVGQETGGSAFTVVGAPDKIIVLPHTQIQVTIPLHQFILQDYKNVEKTGVIPHHITAATISDILENRDVEYELIQELIKNK